VIILSQILGSFYPRGTGAIRTSYTSMLNLDRKKAMVDRNEKFTVLKPLAMPKISQLRAICKNCRKSMAWKMRSLIGEKVKWYEIPEEV
jgi:hypothetical protein